MTTTCLDPNDPDIIYPDGDEDDPCPTCGVQMAHDRHEQMDYCPNDWYHG